MRPRDFQIEGTLQCTRENREKGGPTVVAGFCENGLCAARARRPIARPPSLLEGWEEAEEC
jgi:hypothetical protein